MMAPDDNATSELVPPQETGSWSRARIALPPRPANQLILRAPACQLGSSKASPVGTGGIAQIEEEVRDVWLSRWLRDFTYDLRLSTRSFLRMPSFVLRVLRRARIGATTCHLTLWSIRCCYTPFRCPARTSCPDRLARGSSREWLRQLESDVVPDLPRS